MHNNLQVGWVVEVFGTFFEGLRKIKRVGKFLWVSFPAFLLTKDLTKGCKRYFPPPLMLLGVKNIC